MWEHIYQGLALAINMYHAGYNMIPQVGWQQAIEAWAADKNHTGGPR
jgi:hypothetical protein